MSAPDYRTHRLLVTASHTTRSVMADLADVVLLEPLLNDAGQVRVRHLEARASLLPHVTVGTRYFSGVSRGVALIGAPAKLEPDQARELATRLLAAADAAEALS